MIVEVLAIGTELLLGQIVNSNATRIGERLADAGLDHYQQTVVGDNDARIVEALADACSRADAVIITGGLGPTRDDLTREAMARAAGVELVFDNVQADALRARWELRGRTMPDSNLRQAERPEGSTLIPNPKGTAPGIRMLIDGTWVSWYGPRIARAAHPAPLDLWRARAANGRLAPPARAVEKSLHPRSFIQALRVPCR